MALLCGGVKLGDTAIGLQLLDVVLLPLHELIDISRQLLDLNIISQLLVLGLFLALLLLHLLFCELLGLALRLCDSLRALFGGKHGTLLASGIVDRRAVIATINLFDFDGLFVEPILGRLKPDLDLR